MDKSHICEIGIGDAAVNALCASRGEQTDPQARYADYGAIVKYKDLAEHSELIKQKLRDYIRASVEDYDLTVDEVSEYQTLLDNIERDGVEPHAEAIQNYIFELFDAVIGMPRRYLDDKSIAFFDAVCEYEDLPEQTAPNWIQIFNCLPSIK